jgi:hypothetical protein
MQQPDLVVVAGDWTYEPEDKLVQELEYLKKFKLQFIQFLGTMMSNILVHLFNNY